MLYLQHKGKTKNGSNTLSDVVWLWKYYIQKSEGVFQITMKWEESHPQWSAETLYPKELLTAQVRGIKFLKCRTSMIIANCGSQFGSLCIVKGLLTLWLEHGKLSAQQNKAGTNCHQPVDFTAKEVNITWGACVVLLPMTENVHSNVQWAWWKHAQGNKALKLLLFCFVVALKGMTSSYWQLDTEQQSGILDSSLLHSSRRFLCCDFCCPGLEGFNGMSVVTTQANWVCWWSNFWISEFIFIVVCRRLFVAVLHLSDCRSWKEHHQPSSLTGNWYVTALGQEYRMKIQLCPLLSFCRKPCAEDHNTTRYDTVARNPPSCSCSACSMWGHQLYPCEDLCGKVGEFCKSQWAAGRSSCCKSEDHWNSERHSGSSQQETGWQSWGFEQEWVLDLKLEELVEQMWNIQYEHNNNKPFQKKGLHSPLPIIICHHSVVNKCHVIKTNTVLWCNHCENLCCRQQVWSPFMLHCWPTHTHLAFL